MKGAENLREKGTYLNIVFVSSIDILISIIRDVFLGFIDYYICFKAIIFSI